MTNKRKIQILKKVIKAIESSPSYGLCYNIFFIMTIRENIKAGCVKPRDYIRLLKQEFRINLPPVRYEGYCWKLSPTGYQARIKACKDAIIRLEKDSK